MKLTEQQLILLLAIFLTISMKREYSFFLLHNAGFMMSKAVKTYLFHDIFYETIIIKYMSCYDKE